VCFVFFTQPAELDDGADPSDPKPEGSVPPGPGEPGPGEPGPEDPEHPARRPARPNDAARSANLFDVIRSSVVMDHPPEANDALERFIAAA
jgi:hypothetical protein